MYTRKIIFESYPEIAEDDEVNFGKSIVRINFNSQSNNLLRTVKVLEVKSITCLTNQACTIERGNATSCPQSPTGSPSSTTLGTTAVSGGGKEETSATEEGSSTTPAPIPTISTACGPHLNFILLLLTLTHFTYV